MSKNLPQCELLRQNEKTSKVNKEFDAHNTMQGNNKFKVNKKEYSSVFYYNPQSPKDNKKKKKSETISVINYPPSPRFGEISFG